MFRDVRLFSLAGAFALAMVVLIGCSEGGGGEDPAQAYEKLVKAATAKDYGYLYDALDHDMKLGFDSLIALSYRSRATMSPDEKAFWDSVGTRAPREAFIAVMGRDPMYTASLIGDYRVVKADTIVVLSIEKGGQGDLRYFTPEGGTLKVTSAPIAPQLGGMPPGHPGMGGEGMGNPHEGMEGMGAPNDSIHGGTGSAPAPGDTAGR